MFNNANETIFYFKVEGLELPKLQVLAFEGIEGLNTEYVFEITLVSKHLRYDITQLLSKKAYLSFSNDLNNGAHGVIQAVKRGSIGTQYAEFKVILTPFFTHLHKRINQRAFVNKSVPEIITIILNEYGLFESSDFELKFKDKQIYKAREFCCQYQESDADYIYRLCEEWGIAIHYEFTPTSHKMIFSDAQPFFPRINGTIDYAANSGMVADHPVFKRFDVALASAPLFASERNYNFKNKKTPEDFTNGFQHTKANKATELNIESYHYPGQHAEKEEAKYLSSLAIERLRANQIVAEAYSDVPQLHSGYHFTVSGYPSVDTLNANEPWLITQIRHQGRQPQVLTAYGDSSSADSTLEPCLLADYIQQPINKRLQFPTTSFEQGYRNCLIATPQAVIYRPAKLHPKPHVLDIQTAVVTGPQDEEIYCDEYGRVKIQFHWDRDGTLDENSSHWVRVATNWAHNKYGTIAIPRIGMEVLVQCIGGDPDNPIIIEAIHNGVNQVPYDLPGLKVQSTFKSKEYKGNGYNELLIDDTTNEIKTQLHSTYESSQLTLGFLTHPRDKDGGGEARGKGFELRTDAWGAIRTGEGMYLSANKRERAKSKQLDLEEAINQLESSLALAKNLAKAAERATASSTDINDQADQLKNVFTELTKPAILASAPEGIALATPKSIQLSAEKNLTLTASLNTDISTAENYRVNAGSGISLLATNQEMKLIAHKDKIRVQANDNNIELTADKTVKVISVNDKVMVSAEKELLLTCGGAYIKLTNGNIYIHAPGTIEHKASSHPIAGPTSLNLGFEGLPKGDTYDLQIKLIDEATGKPITNSSYQMFLSNGRIIEGKTDNQALTSRVWSTEKLTIDKIVLLEHGIDSSK